MCGSTRFADLMAVLSWEMEKLGYIVLRVNFVPDWYVNKSGMAESSHIADQQGLKEELDTLHFRKIDLADKVYVCDFMGYIGESTRNELNYALETEKPVMYLNLGVNNEFSEMANRMADWFTEAHGITE